MRKLKNSTELQETTDDFVLPQEVTTSSGEELLFPDDEDVIEYINELTQEAIEEQKRGEKFYSLEELQSTRENIYKRAKRRRRS